MYEVKLPTLDWFNYGNVYSGSLRTNPYRGCLSQTTFNYRVKIYTDKNIKTLVAVCWFELPWGSVSNMRENTVGQFEADNFGIEVAENWLRDKFFVSYKNPNILENSIKMLRSNWK